MSKKKSKDKKEIARLRREVEVLRAQLAKEEKVKPRSSEVKNETKDVKEVKVATLKAPDISYDYVREGLKRTAILTLVAFAALIGLYFSHSQWSQLLP